MVDAAATASRMRRGRGKKTDQDTSARTVLILIIANVTISVATLACLWRLWLDHSEHSLQVPQASLAFAHRYKAQAALSAKMQLLPKPDMKPWAAGNQTARSSCLPCNSKVHGPLPTTRSRDPWKSCSWTELTGMYLLGFAENLQVRYELSVAQKFCVQLGSRCSGVTCEAQVARSCTVRSGRSGQSSKAGEVSYLKRCEISSDDCDHYPAQTSTEGGPTKELLNAAVVVLAHNRADDLILCLSSLLQQRDVNLFKVYVSLDDAKAEPDMRRVVSALGSQYGQNVTVLSVEPRKVDLATDNKEQQIWFKMNTGKIAHHYWVALESAFMNHSHDFAIFVEEDLVFAPDFLALFRSTVWLLEEDPSLWCISAWNDHGFAISVWDECRLFRTSYFPGLGFLLPRAAWLELRLQWPSAPTMGWDYWMRTAFRRADKECIVPEVPRSHHASKKGASIVTDKQVKFFEAMSLATQPNSCSIEKPCRQFGDVTYLLRPKYEAWLLQAVEQAKPMHASATIYQAHQECSEEGAALGEHSNVDACAILAHGTPSCSNYITFAKDYPYWQCRCCKTQGFKPALGKSHAAWDMYTAQFDIDPSLLYLYPYIKENYVGIGGSFGIRLENMGAVIPEDVRSEHYGLIVGRHLASRATVLLADKRSPKTYLPSLQRIVRRADLKAVAAERNISCTQACSERSMSCESEQLHFLNNCPELEQHFGCSLCAHQVGAELPVQVVGEEQPTFGQCLVTFISAFKCDAKHAATRRLCPCVPGT